MDEHISNGFLYTLWNDQLTVKEGMVLRNQWCSSREAIFQYSKRDADWTKCHPEPGKLVQAKMWLPERNDELGRRILADYHKACIENLKKKIASHEEKIKILEG